MNSISNSRRALPSIDSFLRERDIQPLLEHYGRTRVLYAVREQLSAERSACSSTSTPPSIDTLIARCTERLENDSLRSLRRVFNLTGTVIHTNLGRSIMPQCVVDAVAEAITRTVNLEFNLDEGKRGDRNIHIESLLTRLTGAEAALAVNNNAAGVYLMLNTLAFGREVPVSRGELVEIGGSFRVPDIMKRSGAVLVEVGSTNRTHLKDYVNAVGEKTAALMKVHTSNYRIEGFTAEVDEHALAQLARLKSIPLLSDLGSGTLVDLRQYGLPYEPTPQEMLGCGVDLVTFSGDKLLGGPQAGLIVGRKDLIEKLRDNPMMRAMRLDKMTLAALEAVLSLYKAPDLLCRELPVLRLLTRSLDSIRDQTKRLLPSLQSRIGGQYIAEIIDVRSQVGSGSLPVELLESCAVRVQTLGKRNGSASSLVAAAFRRLPIPVIGRQHDGDFLLDLRCLEEGEENEFIAQLPKLQVGKIA